MNLDKKNFYFVRHGETEFNAKKILHDGLDIPLNNTGRHQASTIQPIIGALPIQTVCVSPLQRALETKEIITKNMSCQTVVIEELSECPGDTWKKITQWEANPTPYFDEAIQVFMHRVIIGINKALTHEGPVLIVAHGGVHWVMTHHMNIENYPRRIANCVPVHFSVSESGWQGEHLYTH